MSGATLDEERHIAQLLRLNRELAQAERNKDVEALDRLIGADFEGITPDGGVVGKETVIARFSSPELVLTRLEPSDVRVRLFWSVALVTGRTRMEGKMGAQTFSGHFRYGDLWVSRGGGWQVVASQMTGEAPARR
jgi:hypothetical protein